MLDNLYRRTETVIHSAEGRSLRGVSNALSGGIKSRLTKDEHPTRVETTLFQCPDCDRVFIATRKNTCSSCDTAVARIENES
jgi:predicted RNA-binding Zn-ribbon protein involved in translation (DUF1610 family)